MKQRRASLPKARNKGPQAEVGRSSLVRTCGYFFTCHLPGFPKGIRDVLCAEADTYELDAFLHDLAAGKTDQAFQGGGFAVRPDRLLLDLNALDVRGLSPQIFQRDARLLNEILEAHGSRVRAMLENFRKNPRKAAAIAKEIGLTEQEFIKRGGGFFWVLVILVGAALLSGCGTTEPVRKRDDEGGTPLSPSGEEVFRELEREKRQDEERQERRREQREERERERRGH